MRWGGTSCSSSMPWRISPPHRCGCSSIRRGRFTREKRKKHRDSKSRQSGSRHKSCEKFLRGAGKNACPTFCPRIEHRYTARVFAGALSSIPTPAIVIDAEIVRRNLRRMADYVLAHRLRLRPHTKTHKSRMIGKLQIEHGAAGLTVAKAGEAKVMAEIADDVLMAYPAVDQTRAAQIADLARRGTLHVALDSTTAVDVLAEAARSAGSTVGVLVDVDVGLHRTGVQSPAAALALSQYVARHPGLRLDGIMFYPGHVWAKPEEQGAPLRAIDEMLGETIALWCKAGLEASIVSGGSTPTALQSHHMTRLTEIRPGTYVYND